MLAGEEPDWCPYGRPGDRLWVRETWQAIHVSVDPETGIGDDYWACESIPENTCNGYWVPVYAASDKRAAEPASERGFPWRPSIHMPRWASRLTLEVTEVRVQRLHEISAGDVQAEGVAPDEPCDHTRRACEDIGCIGPYRAAFAELWDLINGRRADWESNPWVWAITFKLAEPARG
jgi:hypothetical protein